MGIGTSRRFVREQTSLEDPSTSTPRSAKRRKTTRIMSASPVDSHDAVGPTGQSDGDEKGDLKELEVLFNLWRSAGRHVNLWDWLEGFRGSMMDVEQKGVVRGESEAALDSHNNGALAQDEVEEISHTPRAGPIAKPPAIEMEQNDERDEEKAARLHATFVRFCEEARMMGLVRARGRTKRADEVVKSIALV